MDAQTEARAIAWRGEYKQPGTDRWIVRYVDDGEPKGKNWRNVTPLVDARRAHEAQAVTEAARRVLKWVEPIAGDNRDMKDAKEEIDSVEALKAAMDTNQSLPQPAKFGALLHSDTG